MIPRTRAEFLHLVWSVVRYGIVGISNTLLDAGLYAIFTRSISWLGQHYLVANFFSFAITTVWSFHWNRKWTFRVKTGSPRSQYMRFVAISIVGLGISEAVLWASVELLDLHDLVGKIITIPAVFLWNFIMHLAWTFRGHAALAEPASKEYTIQEAKKLRS